MPLNKSELLSLGAARRSRVVVEGGEVLVRELSVGDRAHLRSVASGDPAKVPGLVMRLCVINEDGTPVFGDQDDDAISALRTDFVDAIARAAMRISGMTEDGSEKKD